MNENTPIVAATATDQLPAIKTEVGIQPIELDNISALHTAEEAPFDLMADYWSPTQVGESRRLLFDRIQPMGVVDQQSGEIMELTCAFFFYQETPTSPIKQIRNGSKRLVGTLESFNVQRLTPLLIKYLGKVKNKNNSNYSDNWSITPLRVDVPNK